MEEILLAIEEKCLRYIWSEITAEALNSAVVGESLGSAE